MSIACLFSGRYCEADEIAGIVAEKTGSRIIGDSEIAGRAAELSGMSPERIGRAFTSGTSIFNKFNHEKERAVSWLRLATAQALAEAGSGHVVLHGFTAMLTPSSVTHLLHACLIAGLAHRVGVAGKLGVNAKQAQKTILQADEDCAAWIKQLFQAEDPWSWQLYDLLVPVDKAGVNGAADLILTQLGNAAVKRTPSSEQALKDFLLAAEVETALATAGHHVEVSAKSGKITLTINRNVLMLERLERELSEVARVVPGVTDVATKVGPAFHQTDIYRRVDFELPSRVLLVDDEREFVQALSERLMLRDMGSAVAYDGESALDLISTDEPEVMVLDLKMPGIDGIEVLRRVKETRPGVQVIILTGHGTEKDREICMQLGAFAYLHKPVDIDTLSKTIRQAHERAAAQAV